MCLVVYLGVNRPIEGFSRPATGEIGLEPVETDGPKALADKSNVYAVVDYWNDMWCCSCVFWQSAADEYSAPAYSRIRAILDRAVQVDAEPLVFACWSGDEGLDLETARDVTPDDFRVENALFEEIGEINNQLYRVHATNRGGAAGSGGGARSSVGRVILDLFNPDRNGFVFGWTNAISGA